MATAKSEAKAKVSLDSASFEKGAKAITNAANTMSAAVVTALAATGVALIAAFGAESIGAIKDSLKEVLNLGESMANAGHAANIAAGQFYLFHNAVEKGLSLKTVAGLLGDNAEVLNRSASIFRDVSIKLWAIGEKIKGFWLGLLDRLSPVLSKLLDGALGVSLVSAGQAFGEALANAVKVVYQLAEDGKLWDTLKAGFKLAFDYAGERLIWLVKLAYDLFKVQFSSAFAEGIVAGIGIVWDELKKFTEHFSNMLGDAIFDYFTKVTELVYGLLDKMDSFLSSIGLISEEAKNKNAKDRALDISDRRSGFGDEANKDYTPTQGANIGEILKGIFEANKFKPSEELSSEIDNFGKTLSENLSKYDQNVTDAPAKSFENNTRRTAFGADSLAAIGAGGNVYTGLSVLDVNKAQLQELKEIKGLLAGGKGDTTDIYNGAPPTADGISRAQTSSPV